MDITSYLLGKQAGGGGGGGDTPTKGVILSEWDENGYPHKAEIKGLSAIPKTYFYVNGGNDSYPQLPYYLEEVILPSNTISIGENSFCYLENLRTINLSNVTSFANGSFTQCPKLENIGSLSNSITTIPNNCFSVCRLLKIGSLPSGLTSIGSSAFSGCNVLDITTIPDGVTTLLNASFSNSGIKKISMNNVQKISGNSSYQGSFYNCTSLKQVWIGSAIATSQIERYAFFGDNNIEKMYIDLPRATVEAFTNYQYAFMNNTSKTGIIVCNDDPGFIDKASFDALPV